MATVNKDFKIKSGLIVEGLQGTINNKRILTESQASQDFILDLIGGETLVKSVSNQFDVSAGGELSLDRTVVDAYYDAAGTAASEAGAVAGDLSDHEALTSGVHGVTGSVVGTTDTQDLSNKRFIDTTYFTDGVTIANEGQIAVIPVSHEFEIKANYGDLALKSLNDDVVLTPGTGKDVKWGSDVVATRAYADQAETDANLYTDGRETAITTAYEAYADQAEVDAKAYTDTREGAITTAYQAYADQAETDAKAYADTQVANLVDSAPALLNTLNELAAAIGDDANFATTLSTSVGEKVAKAGDTMTGALTLSGAPTSNLHAATKAYVDTAETDAVTSANSYTDGRETAITTAYQSYADQAEVDAKAYADALTTSDIAEGTNLYFTNQRAIDAVGGTIGDQINLLDTDDIEEGATNLYHTDARAKASAANLLLNASLTNIAITGTSTTGLIITAENGVADSDTDDLVEGTTNLYFTDSRAVDALEAVVPNFTAVEVNSVAKQVASTMSAASAGAHVGHAFAKADYRSAEFLVKVAYGSHTEISKVLLTLDASDNIAMTEYGIVGTNGTAMSVSANVDGANVQLLVTTTNNNSTVTVVGTLLA
jgi:hypothetical protein